MHAKYWFVLLALGAFVLLPASASAEEVEKTESDAERADRLEKRVDELEEEINVKLEAIADAVETNAGAREERRVHIGGYGEMHFNYLDVDGEDFREIDFHRLVLFFGYDFNDRARFVTEFEVEHIIVSPSRRGAVEVEQAYLEFDVLPNLHVKTGAILMPLGIINLTHEPPTFYGVERPLVDRTIIPSTWWSAGIQLTHRLETGIEYDLMVSEGLKTQDPTSVANAQPFNIRLGKQKASFADAFDPAITGRIRYSGIPGLELAVFGQYQFDLDQSADDSYADDATLFGANIIYGWRNFEFRGLYARWDLYGELAADAEQDVQQGGYVELSYKPIEKLGVFVRQSIWSLETSLENMQTDIGLNWWPYSNIVFKFDYQFQNEDAGDVDGFNLGMGYQF